MKLRSVVPGLPKTWRTPRARSISNIATLASMPLSPLQVDRFEAFPGEVGPAAVRQDLLLRPVHPLDGVVEPPGDLVGNRHDAVLIRVQQIAGPHRQAVDLDRIADADQVHVGAGDHDASGEKVKAERAHLVEIADAAVRDRTHTTQRMMDRTLHLAPKRADTRRIIQVLD